MLGVGFFSPVYISLIRIKTYILNSLTRRMLVFTILFVIVSEIFILAPVIAKYRFDCELLENAGVYEVILRRHDKSSLILGGQLPHPVDETFDLHEANLLVLLRDASIFIFRPMVG